MPRVQFTYEQVKTKGRAPCARYQHAACYFQTDSRRLLIVHGGRNDDIYNEMKDCALNDLHLLELGMLEWQRVVIFGSLCEQRWAHQMSANGT